MEMYCLARLCQRGVHDVVTPERQHVYCFISNYTYHQRLKRAEQVHKAEGPRPVHPQQVVTADKLSRKRARKLMGAAQRVDASSNRHTTDPLQGNVQETDGMSASFSITNLVKAHRLIVTSDRQ